MVQKLPYLFLAVLFSLSSLTTSYAQEEKVYFSEALNKYLLKYNKLADKAIAAGRFDQAKSLFDSLVENHLEGTTIDPLNFEGYKTRLRSTLDFDKPTVIYTYSSWCIPSAGEIPVLNKMASRYGDMVDFVVLYFDNRKSVRKQARQFDRNVHVVYVDETTNDHMLTEKLMKQSLGTSLAVVVSASGEILDISRRPPNHLDWPLDEQLATNFSFISRQITSVFIDTDKDVSDLPESYATWE